MAMLIETFEGLTRLEKFLKQNQYDYSVELTGAGFIVRIFG